MGLGTVAVLVGDGGGQGDLAGQGQRIVGIAGIGMGQGPQLLQGNLAVTVDGDAEGHGAGAFKAPFHTIGGVVEEDPLTGGGVFQAAIGVVRGFELVADGAGAVRTELAVEQVGDGVAGGGLPELGLVHGEVDIATFHRRDARAIVEEGELAAQIETGALMVAVGVGHGGRQADLAGAQAQRVVGIGSVRVHQRTHLVERDLAVATQGHSEGDRPVGTAHTSFDAVGGVEQEDLVAGGGVFQPAVGIVGRTDPVGDGAGAVSAELGVEQITHRHAAGGVLAEVGLVHGQMQAFGIAHGDGRAVIGEAHPAAEVDGAAGGNAVAVAVGDRQVAL